MSCYFLKYPFEYYHHFYKWCHLFRIYRLNFCVHISVPCITHASSIDEDNNIWWIVGLHMIELWWRNPKVTYLTLVQKFSEQISLAATLRTLIRRLICRFLADISGTLRSVSTSLSLLPLYYFRFLWSCIVSKIWRKKTNKMQQLDVYY